jgi:hypothetical protein
MSMAGGRVVEPKAHGTHHLQAVKPGCRNSAALAGLGHLGTLTQRTNEMWTSDKRSGPRQHQYSRHVSCPR